MREKLPDVLRNDRMVLFEREVPGIEQVDLDVLQVGAVRLGPFDREHRVALAPHARV